MAFVQKIHFTNIDTVDSGKIGLYQLSTLTWPKLDIASHSKLLVINRYGITGSLYNWILDYLKDRYQAVLINDSLRFGST